MKLFQKLSGFFAVIALIFVLNHCGAKSPEEAGDPTAPKVQYYAVALTNGNLFFGQITKEDERNIHMADIYYFRTNPSPKKGEEPRAPISLVSQVEDFYGPKAEMTINREQVLYYQPLRPASRVLNLIAQIRQKTAQALQAQKEAAQPQTAVPPTAAAPAPAGQPQQ